MPEHYARCYEVLYLQTRTLARLRDAPMRHAFTAASVALRNARRIQLDQNDAGAGWGGEDMRVQRDSSASLVTPRRRHSSAGASAQAAGGAVEAWVERSVVARELLRAVWYERGASESAAEAVCCGLELVGLGDRTPLARGEALLDREQTGDEFGEGEVAVHLAFDERLAQQIAGAAFRDCVCVVVLLLGRRALVCDRVHVEFRDLEMTRGDRRVLQPLDRFAVGLDVRAARERGEIMVDVQASLVIEVLDFGCVWRVGTVRAGLARPRAIYATGGAIGLLPRETVSLCRRSTRGPGEHSVRDLRRPRTRGCSGRQQRTGARELRSPRDPRPRCTAADRQPAAPKIWSGNRYDIVWVFVKTTTSNGQTGYRLSQVPQLLLPSDSSKPIGS